VLQKNQAGATVKGRELANLSLAGQRKEGYNSGTGKNDDPAQDEFSHHERKGAT